MNLTIKEKIYLYLKKIPRSKVTSYKLLAEAVGLKKAYRFVGKVMSENPNPIQVPCHRVVSSNGRLTGYALGINKKKQLLMQEGIRFKGEKIINFKDHLYHF